MKAMTYSTLSLAISMIVVGCSADSGLSASSDENSGYTEQRLESTYNGPTKSAAYDICTDLELRSSQKRLFIVVPDHFQMRADLSGSETSLVRLTERVTAQAFLVEQSIAQIESDKLVFEQIYNESKTSVFASEASPQYIRVSAAGDWAGFFSRQRRIDTNAESLQYIMWRRKQVITVFVESSVPGIDIRKDADTFILAILKAISKW